MNSKKIFLKISIVLVILSMMCCSMLTYYAVEQSAEITDDASNTDQNGWIPDRYERLTPPSDGMLSMPEKYDPRPLGIFTDVKDQGDINICWMYANAGSVEQYISKNYGSKFNISAAHGGVAMSNSIGNGTVGYYNNNADFGGNSAKALQYFTNWNAPIFNDETFQWNSSVSENAYPLSKVVSQNVTPVESEFFNAPSLFNVTSAHYLEIREPEMIKNAIKQYGGVVTGITNIGLPVLNQKGEWTFYSDSASLSTEHAVLIVGWDDNYSKDNFSGNKPARDGAWLVKDSRSSYDYFWMSYQEGSLLSAGNEFSVVTGVQKATDNEHMLSYDYFIPAYNNSFYFCDDVYLCNVFDISDYTNTYNQINKVMLYLRANRCRYEVRVMQTDRSGNLPNNLDSIMPLATGTYAGEGYLTVPLNTPFKFSSNNKCAVFVKLSPVSSTSKINIPYEGTFLNNRDTQIVKPQINDGESYYGTEDNIGNINWKDCNVDNSYSDDGEKGNLIIRPVLSKSNITPENVTVTPDKIIDNDSDLNIQINSEVDLFSIHTASNYVLRQDVDYVRTANGIILKSGYINSLNNAYTELVLEFNNDTTKVVEVNPKAVITDVSISGKPIIGDTLTAVCTGIPEKDEYTVNYQWQSSINGTVWTDIANAGTAEYTVNVNDTDRYLRVKITSPMFGNVEYPMEKYSASTECKAVLLGDVNMDGKLTVSDCTLIQNYVMEMAEFSKEQMLAADVNRDNIINITDSTELQKIISKR